MRKYKKIRILFISAVRKVSTGRLASGSGRAYDIEGSTSP